MSSINLSVHQEQAKKIMGKSYLGPEEVMKHFEVAFSDKELIQLREIPFTEAELEACKNTHILFVGYPLSIVDIRNKAKQLFYNQDWYDKQAFATKEKVYLQWHLIRKNEVPNSTSKTFNEQKALLTGNETVPRACEVVFMIILYFLVTGKRLLENMYVRCSDLVFGGWHVFVGVFASDGFGFSGYWDSYHDDYLGLAAARE